jgi:DNA end-binding protein Ku
VKEEGTSAIEIVEFVTPGEVDLAYIEKSYWVGPGGKNSNSFSLLRAVLEKTERVAVAKVAVRTRARLALLRPRERFFSLDMMRFAAELVPSKEIEAPVAKVPNEKELKLAESLVDQLMGRFDPQKHPDEYRARIEAMAEKKLSRHETVSADAKAASKAKGKIIDLTDLLRRSLEMKHAAHASTSKTRQAKPAKTDKRSPAVRSVRKAG